MVTAAHCVDGLVASVIQVLVGTDTLTPGTGDRVPVRRILTHPSWQPTTQIGDLALIELTRPSTVAAGTVRLATPQDGALLAAGVPAVAVGWGATDVAATHFLRPLQEAHFPILAASACGHGLVPPFVVGEFLCGGSAQANTCSGDSGGPLLVQATTGDWVEVGITSYGPCDAPAVYANVARLSDWVAATTGVSAVPKTIAVVGRPSGRRLLDRSHRRRRDGLRRRPGVPAGRLDHPAGGGRGGRSLGRRAVGGGRRRWRVHARRHPVLRVDRQPQAQPADRGDGRHHDRSRVLARGRATAGSSASATPASPARPAT